MLIICNGILYFIFCYYYYFFYTLVMCVWLEHAGMMKTFNFDQVLKHDKTEECCLIIQGKVYDVTPFMEDHPGGSEVLLAATGKDATADFEDIGHSHEAIGMMDKYCIGKPLEHATAVPLKCNYAGAKSTDNKPYKTSQLAVKILQFLVPLFVFILAFAVRSYAKH
ncbi:cytochrome b5-like [Bidens hawaiensis]|uniref:cytochrome b5-like n=1 Tax=Bidens hawaiensis TaxID=980011 RepID=UPI0040490EAD